MYVAGHDAPGNTVLMLRKRKTRIDEARYGGGARDCCALLCCCCGWRLLCAALVLLLCLPSRAAVLCFLTDGDSNSRDPSST